MYVLNFKILGQVVPEKSLTKVSIFITLEIEIEKGKNRKRRQNKSQHLGFVYSNTLGCLGQVVAEKSLTKNISGKKEKRTNKGTD